MHRALLLLAACGTAAAPVRPLESHDHGSARCTLPARIAVNARRYGNVDNDDPTYGKWTPWQIELEVARSSGNAVAGKLVMSGDRLAWVFTMGGSFDPTACELHLYGQAHDPLEVDLHVAGRIEGTIKTIDDVWRIGDDPGPP
jgi:hypothetical protein